VFFHHCSPTFSSRIFLPRRVRDFINLVGENGAMLMSLLPRVINCVMISPVTGDHKMPQQLCAVAMYAPSIPSTGPRIGTASGAHGLMHACVVCGCLSPPPMDFDIPPKLRIAAATRLGSSTILSLLSQSPPGKRRFSSTYTEPPMPHKYTSPLDLGYTSK